MNLDIWRSLYSDVQQSEDVKLRVPAKPSNMYSKKSFVVMVCITTTQTQMGLEDNTYQLFNPLPE